MKRAIVWFRQDLRLSDNPALHHAHEKGFEIIPLFINETDTNKWSIGAAQKWWLHHSLSDFSQSIGKMNGELILKTGNVKNVLLYVIDKTKASAVFWNRCYDPFWRNADQVVIKALKEKSIGFETFRGNVIFEPGEVLSKKNTPLGVFTPYWKNMVTKTPSKPFPKSDYKFLQDLKLTEKLEDWKLLSTKDWADEWSKLWSPGESGAQKSLQDFLEHVTEYKESREIMAKKGTSKLSPHLRFGEISPVQIWHGVVSKHNPKDLSAKASSVEVYLSEIGWRDFWYQLLYYHPDLPENNYQKNFDKFEWSYDKEALAAWKKGKTGYPVVDAAMRELWKTGWMHNRARMIVGSFLVKDLLLPWMEGEKWFWYTLLDADLASNAGNWQWVAGTGTDSSPFFRVFNPTLQGEKFDPKGEYIRKWCPELSKLPDKYIHEPWNAPSDVLKKAGIKLGENYPKPIVDHKAARDRALKAFSEIKKGTKRDAEEMEQ